MRTSVSIAVYALLSVVLLCAVVDFSDAFTDYCRASLCRRRTQHIACKYYGGLGPKCESDAYTVPMSSDLKEFILNKHNTLRNTIAKGELSGFKPAARMATMYWDNELERLASMNVKQCEIQVDDCRYTKKFPYYGQNVGYIRWKHLTNTVESVANALIMRWFNEYKNTTKSQIYNFEGNGKKVAHFTQMVLEKATHIGCGILRQTKKEKTYQFFTCNYAFVTFIDRPVYVSSSKGGSKCKTGTNPFYKSLCAFKEVYYVKKV